MSTQWAHVNITNNTGGNARIYLYHKNWTNDRQGGNWTAKPGETVGPLTAYFTTTGDSPDWWFVLVHVKDGPTPGFYSSYATHGEIPAYHECQLKDSDGSKIMTFAVSPTEFDMKLHSHGCTGRVKKLAPYAPISHVFVVMLENRSFDTMFAMSGIKGIRAATVKNFNEYKNKVYTVQTCAQLSLPTDPGHEFLDVVEQLCGEGAQKKWDPKTGIYPPMDNMGFVANYATTTDEGTGLPPEGDIGDVMACFATPHQLPTIFQLAKSFTLCDQWYSSLPGLTWPNRFFLHGASSSGMDANPSKGQIEWWELDGFKYPNGSIYDALKKAGTPYRFYNDTTGSEVLGKSIYSDHPEKGSVFGAVPQVTSLHGVELWEIWSLQQFASDLQGPYPYPYTFIEPHYGNVKDDTYEGGSSQHPMDNMYGGEHLLAAVYSAIRNSPYWDSSLLVITYDEHGGLFDMVSPPRDAKPPGDNPPPGYNVNGFKFDVYGVRVPAIVVSPLIPAGRVDKTLYDHTSVLKTLEDLFGLKHLTERDKAANSLVHLPFSETPRTDCPTSLDVPPRPMETKPPMTAEERARLDALPLPDSGNLVNALYTLKKAEIAMSGKTPPELAAIHARFATIQTRGDAEAYARSVLEKVRIIQAQRKLESQLVP